MTHREICFLVSGWLLSQSNIQHVAYEMKYQRSVFDVIGLGTKSKIDKRITIVEVKASRSDMLQDLKKGKLLKYEAQGTHCYLAATAEAYRTDKLNTLEDLASRGLPNHWGVLLVSPGYVQVLRSARRHRPTSMYQLNTLLSKVARRNMYQLFTQLGIVD